MPYPHSAIRPPLAIATTDPRTWEILNSQQILYMLGLIEDIDPLALTDWFNQQPRDFDISRHSQRLLFERGVQLKEISPPTPAPSLDLFRQRRDFPGLVHREQRLATPEDLNQLLNTGWFVILREYSGTQDIGAIFYGRINQLYLAYHPTRGPIGVTQAVLFRFDTASLQAWRPLGLAIT